VLATLSGFVFQDADTSAVFDNNDVGLSGVDVYLTNEIGETLQTTSKANGAYSFDSIPRGIYSLDTDATEGLLDGAATIGDGGGEVIASKISGIKLNKNQALSGYNFGKLSPSNLQGTTYVDLDRDGNYDAGDKPLAGSSVTLIGVDDLGNSLSYETTTDDDGAYSFGGLRPGMYEILGKTPAALVDGRDTLGTFEGNSNPVTENGILANDRFFSIQLTAGQTGRNYNFGEFDPGTTAGKLATSFEATVVLDGSSADDTFEFIAGDEIHQVFRNGVLVQTIDASISTRIVINTYGGEDRVQLIGGSGIDQVELRETSAKLTGVSYQVLVYSSLNTTVQSGGGQDRALFYDTSGDEVFTASPLEAVLAGSTFENTAYGFHRVYAYASGGDDQAFLVGSDGDDRFKATSNDARLYGNGFYNYARSFDVVHAEAGAGSDDRAYLYDSDGDDTFVSKANDSRLFGDGFDSNSSGFDRVYAYASGGVDTAVFYDTDGADYYRVDNNGARLYGDDYYNRAIGFDVHYVSFSPDDGQDDKVWFGDSAGNDIIIGYQNQFIASRNGALHRVFNPNIVEAHASTGTNRVRIFNGLLFDLALEGDWQ